MCILLFYIDYNKKTKRIEIELEIANVKGEVNLKDYYQTFKNFELHGFINQVFGLLEYNNCEINWKSFLQLNIESLSSIGINRGFLLKWKKMMEVIDENETVYTPLYYHLEKKVGYNHMNFCFKKIFTEETFTYLLWDVSKLNDLTKHQLSKLGFQREHLRKWSKCVNPL